MSRFLCFLPRSSYPLKRHHKSDLTEALSIEKFRINFLLFKSDLSHGSRDGGQGSSTDSLSAERKHSDRLPISLRNNRGDGTA